MAKCQENEVKRFGKYILEVKEEGKGK